MNDRTSPPTPLAEADADGKITRLRGKDMPSGIMRPLGLEPSQAEVVDPGPKWVLAAAYNFVRRVREKGSL